MNGGKKGSIWSYGSIEVEVVFVFVLTAIFFLFSLAYVVPKILMMVIHFSKEI